MHFNLIINNQQQKRFQPVHINLILIIRAPKISLKKKFLNTCTVEPV